MLLIGDKKEMILTYKQGRGPQIRVTVVCFGSKRHYRKDGSCKHTEFLLAHMKPWYKSRCTVILWGDAPPM